MPENLRRSTIGPFCAVWDDRPRDDAGWPAIESIPHNLFPPYNRRYPPSAEPKAFDFRVAHDDALAGVDLGVYDVRWLDWLSLWDIPTNAVFVSLINRSREAGPRQLLP